jgi:DNA replicative helicase MCM subunit Mcm2 (Cdc46/Mcm family)
MRCEKTIRIDYTSVRSIEGFEDARRLVGELNLKVGQGNSKSSYGSVETAPMQEDARRNMATKVASKGLLRTFQEDVLAKYANKEVEVSELLRECEKVGVPNEYADKLIRKLLSSGQAYHPKEGWIRLL